MWLSWRPRQSVALVESKDGIRWSEPPQIVLGPKEETGWEDYINRPVVLRREDGYHLWYTGQAKGHSFIGYATSPDGTTWKRMSYQYVMFYIGFRDEAHAQIGLARSRDGVTNWQRHPANPIIRPGENQWDHDACYKPYAIFDGQKWLLWYNGRHSGLEQIGVVLHPGEDLRF